MTSAYDIEYIKMLLASMHPHQEDTNNLVKLTRVVRNARDEVHHEAST